MCQAIGAKVINRLVVINRGGVWSAYKRVRFSLILLYRTTDEGQLLEFVKNYAH